MAGVKGRSGRKDVPLTTALNLALKDVVRKGEFKGQQRLRVIADQVAEAAAGGEPWAVKEVWDRVEGKPAQQIYNTHEFEPNDAAQAITDALNGMETATAPKANGSANGHDSDTPLDQS